jgi:hypothetical protein
MRIGTLLIALLALVFTACGGAAPQPSAKKNDVAKTTRKIETALRGVSLLSTAPRLQAGESTTFDCTPGSLTVTIEGSGDATSAQGTLKLVSSNCVLEDEDGTSINFNDSNFTYGYNISATETSLSIALSFNGTVKITVGGETETIVYSNLTMTLNIVQSGNNYTYSATINGSVTLNGEVVSFNNESFDDTVLD